MTCYHVSFELTRTEGEVVVLFAQVSCAISCLVSQYNSFSSKKRVKRHRGDLRPFNLYGESCVWVKFLKNELPQQLIRKGLMGPPFDSTLPPLMSACYILSPVGWLHMVFLLWPPISVIVSFSERFPPSHLMQLFRSCFARKRG